MELYQLYSWPCHNAHLWFINFQKVTIIIFNFTCKHCCMVFSLLMELFLNICRMREISRTVRIPLVDKVPSISVSNRVLLKSRMKHASKSIGSLVPLGKVIERRREDLEEFILLLKKDIPCDIQDRDRMAWTYGIDVLCTVVVITLHQILIPVNASNKLIEGILLLLCMTIWIVHWINVIGVCCRHL